jgi:hypothetical protein
MTQTAQRVETVQSQHFHFFLQEKPQTVVVEAEALVLAVAVHLAEQIRQRLRLRQLFTQQTEEQGLADRLTPQQHQGVVCKAVVAVVVVELQQTELQLTQLLLEGLEAQFMRQLQPQQAAAAQRVHQE